MKQKTSHFVFYVPGSIHAIDRAIEKNGSWYTKFFNKNQATMEQEYPGIVVISYEDMQKQINETFKTEPKEINEESFENAFECLPPMGFQASTSSQSFKIMEFYVGDITDIYVCIKHNAVMRYFTFRDLYSLTHSEIINKVKSSTAYGANSGEDPIIPTPKKYLIHTLHGQIETEDFWKEQVKTWENDSSGNTPEQQFEMILDESSEFDYLMQTIEHGALHGLRVFDLKRGAGTVVDVHKECPASIVVDVEFDDGATLGDISVAELSNWIIL